MAYLNNFSIATGDKFLIDWNTPLISDIYVKGKKESCDGFDDPIINIPWFGYHHMCASEKEKKAYRGFSCGSEGMLYKTIGLKDK